MNVDIFTIPETLIAWFKEYGRELPWRRTYDPYHVWISEIMLQQTQMERGVQYFKRWMERFPHIDAVAEAGEQEIMKLWEGLGYYSRARNLHATAIKLKNEYSSVIPCDPEILITLPGIGKYTSAAIASIACDVDIPVIDANVERIFARFMDIDKPIKSGVIKKEIESLATAILPKGRARIYNQALMDLGGIICTPRNPKCEKCPLSGPCLARLRGTIADRPVAGRKQRTIHLEMATGILSHEGKIFIQQREANDIWGGLWEFPGGRVEDGETAASAIVREYSEETGFVVEVSEKITSVTHFYTRYKVDLHCFTCRAKGDVSTPSLTAAQGYRWVFPHELKNFGFPAGHRKFLEYLDHEKPDLLDLICQRSI